MDKGWLTAAVRQLHTAQQPFRITASEDYRHRPMLLTIMTDKAFHLKTRGGEDSGNDGIACRLPRHTPFFGINIF